MLKTDFRIATLKEALLAVRSLVFVSKSESQTAWIGSGSGVVCVKQRGDFIIFEESGIWNQYNNQALSFKNSYRWSLADNKVLLEHLRQGAQNPVLLFPLYAKSHHEWRSAYPHCCQNDKYSARLTMGYGQMNLDWEVIGPKKNAKINYVYKSF